MTNCSVHQLRNATISPGIKNKINPTAVNTPTWSRWRWAIVRGLRLDIRGA
jgi:hypothetical protein